MFFQFRKIILKKIGTKDRVLKDLCSPGKERKYDFLL